MKTRQGSKYVLQNNPWCNEKQHYLKNGKKKNNAHLEPLGLSRQYKTFTQFEKLKQLPYHPLHQTFEERTKNRLLRKCPNHLAIEIYRKHTKTRNTLKYTENIQI